jgi:multidrug efflux pump subunit AcrA (membrane-fusion protein)
MNLMSIIQQERRNTSIEPSEKRIKNRGWVKNAAIIFLSIMLVLTFFSNTFMNYSLPEVAAQYPSYSGIKSQIRGTGTVLANMTTDVKMLGNRTVKSVQVRDGDAVEEGQVLFIFESAEDENLKSLEDELYEAEKNYALYLLGADSSESRRSYSAMRDQIKEEEETLKDHQAALARATNDASIIKDPAAAKDAAEKTIEDMDDEIANADKNIADLEAQLGETGDASEKYKAVSAARKTLNELVMDNQDYREKYAGGDQKRIGQYIDGFLIDLSASYNAYKSGQDVFAAAPVATPKPGDDSDADIDSAISSVINYTANGEKDFPNTSVGEARSILDAYGSWKTADEELSAVATPNQQMISDTIDYFESLKSTLESAKKDAEKKIAAADKVALIQEDIKTSEKNIDSYKKELSVLKDAIDLEEAKGEFDIKDYERNIDEIKAKIEKSEESSGEIEMTAKVGGIINGISVVAGNQAEDGSTLAKIEVVEKGYVSSFAVTNQQAQQIRVGDEVEIENLWWQEVKAVVSAIKNDPNRPGQGRIVEMNVTGDVTVGQTLDFVVGQRSTNYEAVLPKSALREDNNGKFVLYIEAKQTPLSTRYYARRLDVQEQASDDTNVAVSGLMGGEFIITTSTKPIEAGMQVRLSEK